MGDEPFYQVTNRQIYEKVESHDDLLRDLSRDVKYLRDSDVDQHAKLRELHDRLRDVEGHTHDDLASPPKNGNGKRKEWKWLVAVAIGSFLYAMVRQFGGDLPV